MIQAQMAYVISWWLALEIIGVVSFPLVSRVCGSLKDRGYSISKLVGLLILTYLTWMFSSLKILSFGYISILISFLLLAAFSLGAWSGRDMKVRVCTSLLPNRSIMRWYI